MKPTEIIEIILAIIFLITSTSFILFEAGIYGKIFAVIGGLLIIIEFLKGEDNGE